VLGVLVCAGALAAAWAPLGSAALPSPDQLVPNTVARIAEAATRDDGTITRAEFQHALLLAAAGERRPVPRRGNSGYEELAESALAGLIEGVWLKGQAAEMDIVVSHRQIVRERTLIKRENFQSAAEFRQFLRESRFTRRDLYERVELQILAMRMQARVAAGTDSEAEEQKAFREFVNEFNARWRARTVCAPEHAVAYCSNGPERDS